MTPSRLLDDARGRPIIVRLRNWIGDVILGVPALQLLADHGHAPVLVGRGWTAALLAGHDWPVHTRPDRLPDRVAQLRALRRQSIERDAAFTRGDNAIVLPNSFSAALDMRLAGLRAVGYAHEARGFLLARALPLVTGGHALVSYWDLACSFLGIEQSAPPRIGLRTAPQDQAAADALLAGHGIAHGFVVVCPFAGGQVDKQDKTWPDFARFTQALRASGRTIVACPGPGEEDVVHREHPGVTMLEGVKLGVYGALMRRAAVVVANDTGPAHLAAAVDVPVVSVLGPTRPEQWAPWGPQVHVVRHWPRWPSVDEVLGATWSVLASRAS
jgi:heptosyltransferase-2